MVSADLKRLNLNPSPKNYWGIIAIVVIGLLLLVKMARAEDINLNIIAQIESSNNPMAYNKSSGAIGMYQIIPICLKDYNQLNNHKFEISQMFDETKAFIVANWYLNKRIPQLLKHFRIKDTIENRLRAYNSGIGTLVKGRYPTETRNYVKKYLRLAGAK